MSRASGPSDLARIEEADAPIRSLMPEPGRAERLERAMSTAPNGPLRGLVVGVKDIFHVDGLPTTAGSTLPVEELAGPEAAAVSLLRGAGAVVLGKTVSTEFALVEPGPTRNPRNLAHTPGGSSSGSAAAVAAGHCPLALGSQTVGSVIRPAAFCGVVGYKPSYGRISTAGVIPLAESFDTVGLLASNVSWVERAAVVLCAWWRRGAVNHPPVLGIPDGPYLEQASEEALRVLDGLDATRVPLLRGHQDAQRRAPAPAELRDGASPRALVPALRRSLPSAHRRRHSRRPGRRRRRRGADPRGSRERPCPDPRGDGRFRSGRLGVPGRCRPRTRGTGIDRGPVNAAAVDARRVAGRDTALGHGGERSSARPPARRALHGRRAPARVGRRDMEAHATA